MPEQPKEEEFSLSVVIDGATFSAKGPKSEVMRLYAEWKEMAGLNDAPKPYRPSPSQRPPFNAPRPSTNGPRIPTVSAW